MIDFVGDKWGEISHSVGHNSDPYDAITRTILTDLLERTKRCSPRPYLSSNRQTQICFLSVSVQDTHFFFSFFKKKNSVSNKDSLHFNGICGMQMILWLWLWIGMLWDYSVCLRLWQQTWAGPALSCQRTHSGETLNRLEPCCDAALSFSVLVTGNTDRWFNKVTLSPKNAKTYWYLILNDENENKTISTD